MEELRVQDLESVNGGGVIDALLVGGGTVAASWAVPVAFINPVAGAVMALFGGAAALVGCGVDVELIKY